MDVAAIVEAFRKEGRDLVWENEVVERLPAVTRRSQSSGELNMVTAFQIDSENIDDTIQEQTQFYQNLGRSFEWKVFSYDEPSDLVERLSTFGFSISSVEKVVVYPLSKGLADLVNSNFCTVERVRSDKHLADFQSVAERVFGKDYSFTTNQLAEALRTGQTGHDGYVAYVDGLAAAVGRLYTDPKSSFAGLYGGGTLPEFRGQGCYRAVIAARARDAMDSGSLILQVDALPTSLPILIRLGFVPIADTWACNYDIV